MKCNDDMTMFNHPILLLKDKIKTGLNRKQLYLIASLPGFLGMLSLILTIKNLYEKIGIDLDEKSTLQIFGFYIFILAIINLIFYMLLQKVSVRLKRTQETYRILHKNVIEKIREWRLNKEAYNSDRLISVIENILTLFNLEYLSTIHNDKYSICVKYINKVDNKLYPIRIGDENNQRCNDPEELEDSYVYKIFKDKKISYIYVKDIEKLSHCADKTLEPYQDELKARAAKYKYKTFLSLPIRSGFKGKENAEVSFTYGFLGIDHHKSYILGNLEGFEREYFFCLVDLLSELLRTLSELNIKEYNNGVNNE